MIGAPGSSADEWPLATYLELAPVPDAVPAARRHARRSLEEWDLAEFIDSVQLVVSELVTNAVWASDGLAAYRRSRTAGVRLIRLSLLAAEDRVLVQVWDDCRRRPEPREPGPDAETGRGLLLVEALSAEWGVFEMEGQPGKVVWALCKGAFD
jgi:anti-sigma regulatory factor (Ser/Thr protein kinase)